MTPDELKARGLRVKPLEWLGDERSTMSAAGYNISRYHPEDETEARYWIGALCQRCPTLEDAKAAAEADHAARIAAQVDAVEEAAVKREISEEAYTALVQAAKLGRAYVQSAIDDWGVDDDTDAAMRKDLASIDAALKLVGEV